ncbi:MAG: HAD-IIB family hydrolase [Clostridia bacterium]|nr:HAD-IIB family hydrolase [Clostridia bacterium]
MRMNFDGILIMSDMDGTFLGKKSSIVPKNIEAIKYFINNGGRFTFATGRPSFEFNRLVPMVRDIVNAPVATANGSCMYDFRDECAVDNVYLDVEPTLEMLNYVKVNHPEINARFFSNTNILSEEISGRLAVIWPTLNNKDYYKICGPIANWECKKWIKGIFTSIYDDMDDFRLDIIERYGDTFEFNRSSKRLLEFQRIGCNKASRVEWLREYYKLQGVGITIVAAGDYENDLGMLKAANIAVCPANAIGTVKEISDYCLCNPNEGLIADIIEKIEQGIIKV